MEPSAALPLFKRASSEGETAKHLLRSMHKVFSHDLPNQVLVMQKILQTLEEEESEHLTDDGKEQVQRLQVAVHKASRMVRFLKEMSRLPACAPQRDVVSLERIFDDVWAELYQRFPDHEVELAWRSDVPTVVADLRLLTSAIVELLGASLEDHADAPDASWEASAEGRDGEVEIRFWNTFQDTPVSLSTSLRSERMMGDHRMETVLASEWLKLAGGSLKLPPDGSPRREFSLVVPGDTIHG